MAVCASNQSQIIKANTVYAVRNDKYFVDRKAAQNSSYGVPYSVRTRKTERDDRDIFINKLKIWDTQCPFKDKIKNPYKICKGLKVL